MCCVPFANRQPCQRSQRAWVLYGQSNLFERIGAGTLMSTPPTLSITLVKASKSTTTTWFTSMSVNLRTVRIASEAPAELEGHVDLVEAVAGHVHAQVARDREVVQAPLPGVGAQEHDRVRALEARALLDPRRVVGAQEQDGRRVREDEPALRHQGGLGRPREALVRGARAAAEGEVARDAPRRSGGRRAARRRSGCGGASWPFPSPSPASVRGP